MYVADVTDVRELLELRDELMGRLRVLNYELYPAEFEQAAWDVQDIEDRLYELGSK